MVLSSPRPLSCRAQCRTHAPIAFPPASPLPSNRFPRPPPPPQTVCVPHFAGDGEGWDLENLIPPDDAPEIVPIITHQVRLGDLEMKEKWIVANASCAELHPSSEWRALRSREPTLSWLRTIRTSLRPTLVTNKVCFGSHVAHPLPIQTAD